MFKVILEDLKSRVGDKIYLSPDDLEPLLDISKGQQANLRSQNKFPVRTSKIGGKVVVSIYDLAKHLSADCEAEVSATLAKSAPPAEKLSRTTKKTQKGLLEKGWWQFHSNLLFAYIERTIYKETTSKPPALISSPFKGSV